MNCVAVLCLLGLVGVAKAALGDAAGATFSCARRGYMYPDPNNLCFVHFCETAGKAPIKRACPKGVRVPTWWEGGELNMCYIVNIEEHGGEEICLRCDADDVKPTTNCASNPCPENCDCVDTEHTFRCDCPYVAGATHDYGTDPIPDHCQPNMCENGGTCQNQYDGYFCFCPNGYTGFRCEIPICDWHPCLNGGTCVVDEVGYHCDCTNCWEGACCSDARESCAPRCPACTAGDDCSPIDSCECNENLCTDAGSCVDTLLGPRCEDCGECLQGPYCKQAVDSCKCKPDICPEHSTCFDLIDKQAVDCVCNDCYEGPTCQKRTQSCSCDNPCGPGELCTMINGIPLCGCESNCLTGPNCAEVPQTCECANPCENGRCVDTSSGPTCEDCDNCYTGAYCNEQVISCDCNSPCNPNELCDIVNGSPKCACPDCYEGDNCDQKINSCVCSNPCKNLDTCKDGVDGPYCECDCEGAEVCMDRPTGKVCECPICFRNGDTERGCPNRNTHLCECDDPCTGDQQVCVDGDGPGDRPTCPIGNPSSGNAFTVVFEENETEYAFKDIPLELYFTPAVSNSGSRYVNIKSAGLRPDHHCYFNFNFTIPENDVYRYTVERCMMHNLTGLANLAIKATELNKNVMIVYGINKDRWTADGFLAVPDTQAGLSYQTISYSPAHLSTQFAVVALRDNTEVTMTLSDDNDIPGYGSAGSVFKITMDAFQTYQVQARCPNARASKKRQCNNDLSGTIVTSDKPIHVFSGNVRAFIEASEAKSRDHLIEQLVSTDRWGKMFGLVTVPDRAVGEIANVMGLAGKTTSVTITSEDGTTQTFTLPYTDERGMSRLNKYVELESGTRYYIEGNQPLSVMQLVKSRDNYEFNNETIHDPAAITIPPVEQFTNYFFISTPSFSGGETRQPQPYRFTVALLIASQSVYRSIRVNNQPIGESDFLMPWGELQGDRDNLYGAAVRIPHGTNLINGANNFQCIIYGSDDRESYGFPAAMNMAKLVQN